MICKAISIPGTPSIPHEQEAVLHTYLLDASSSLRCSHSRKAVIICPGGGYEHTSDREAEPVAMKFLSAGIHAFVLRYTVEPGKHPLALLQLAQSVQIVREHALEWHIDPEQIYLCGFSAGGHLCAELGTRWNTEFLRSLMTGTPDSWCPNAMILGYPVITSGPLAHRESFDHLLADPENPELLEEVSLEKQVSPDTPPTFLWHTQTDRTVPVENSLLFVLALQKHGIPYEFHLYGSGEHGLSLCSELTQAYDGQVVPHNQGWIDLAIDWMKQGSFSL